MAYGKGEYGQRGFGGSSFEPQVPLITVSAPLNGAVNVGASDPLSLTIESGSGLDTNTLRVTVNGSLAVLAENFLPGFSGSIRQDPETLLIVDFSAHPNFVSSNLVNVTITDLAGHTASLDISFSLVVLGGIVVSESVAVSESLAVSADHFESVSDQVDVTDYVASGSFDVFTVDGNTIRLVLPFELHFDNALDYSNYLLVPNPDTVSPGNPLAIQDVTLKYTIYQTGSGGAVIPDDLNDGQSSVFQFFGSLTEPLNLGDFVFLQDGVNASLYQILEILNPGPTLAKVRLNKPMAIMHRDNGVINTSEVKLIDVTNRTGTLATLSSDLVFRVDHPSITVSTPLTAVYGLERQSRMGESAFEALNATGAIPPEVDATVVPPAAFDLSQVQFLDYQTFKVPNPGQPLLRGTAANDTASSIEQHLVIFQTTSLVDWAHISGVQGVDFRTSKILNNADFLFQVSNVYEKYPRAPYTSPLFAFTSQDIAKPRLASTSLDLEGTLHVIFNDDMRQDADNLINPTDYTITGPTSVRVVSVQSVGPREVALSTEGLQNGSYSLTVSTSTPKDVAGNPLDPTFNAAIFTASTPIRNRSVFTDRGPISKSPLSLQTGLTGTIASSQLINLPGATLTNNDIGKRIRLTGSAFNDTTYKILSVTGPSVLKVQASLKYPDTNSGAIAWEVYDPRNGMIADDPQDVVVRVNGVPVTPSAVIGLRGQVVLPSMPDENDVVDIDYSHIRNPRVEIRRLNSKEFRLNAWNNDIMSSDESKHKYRFNNVLITPSNYVPSDIQATLERPLLRDLKYRGYERAYTATLNDPNRLLLNTPNHKIAYPPPQRTLSETSVFYEAAALPENDAQPWVRRGLGAATASAGHLTITDNSSGTAPSGSGLFWTKTIDLSYDHVFSAAWRFSVTTVTAYEGVWSGITAGYSDTKLAYVVGYLEEAGVKKIGFLRRGAQDNLESAAAWIGGVDSFGTSTGASSVFDWSTLHSYRLFRGPDGIVRLFVDGSIVEVLRILPDEAPFLEEMNGPFEELQGVFFGSLSRFALSESVWDFCRYLAQPLNVYQTSPSSFVSYEAGTLPELDVSPWTPVGFHGTAEASLGYLSLASTSASDDPQGLVSGDFKGYFKIEPLLTAASQFSVDFAPRLLTHTHGLDPYGLMLAVDDSNRLIQVAFLSDTKAPKLSYGGRTLPEDFSPTQWDSLGSQPAVMQGRYLTIQDTSASDGLVYFAEDLEPVSSGDRVIAAGIDYIVEVRLKVNTYAPDGLGYCGAFVQAYDSTRSVGLLLLEVASVRYVALHSEGVLLGPLARFVFNWGDNAFHTYRLRKDTLGNLVSVFVDDTFVGSANYSDFSAPFLDPIGVLSFGSATVSSSQSQSDVEWAYCNAWRVATTERKFVGLWKGTVDNDFTDYHLPLKVSGKNAAVQGNTLSDSLADFYASNIVAGDLLVVDFGPNKGTYEVSNVTGPGNLTILGVWPEGPTLADYRVIRETDWTDPNKYRLFRDSNGEVALFLNADPAPLIFVGYNSLDLPFSGVGLAKKVSSGLATIVFGSLSQEHLAQSVWDFVRYGVTRSPTELRIVPVSHVLNQWNVMESPERLFTTIPHRLTSFKSSSTGITPNTDPDFLARSDVRAYTQLNQGTPLIPLTQSFEVRGPYATQTFISALNSPEDVLNSDGDFSLNDNTLRSTVEVPEDVLYTSLQVIEMTDGDLDLLQPFDDGYGPTLGSIQYQKEVCLSYSGDILPELDLAAGTPWTLNSISSGEVSSSVFGGLLTYGTGGGGTRTVYLNNTPLLDAPSLQTEVTFRLKLVSDATGGTGDSQVRFGISAPGMTLGLGFVTTPTGERLVIVFDINNGSVRGAVTFDYLDGNFHTYRIVRVPTSAQVQVFIDA